MGDRCYIEITMRRADVPRFAPFVDAQPGEDWWDADDPVTDHPDLVTVQMYEANYAWYDQRHEAARAGIPFYGTHGEGGEYGGFAFASLDGEMLEAPLSHEGDLILALNDNLEPVDADDLVHLRAYVARLRAVKRLFGMEVTDGKPSPDQEAEREAVPSGLRPA